MAAVPGKKRKRSSQTRETQSKRDSTGMSFSGAESELSVPEVVPTESIASCSSCRLPIFPQVDSRAEIKCSPPSASELNTPWVLEWTPDWSATLHTACWDQALETARARGRQKMLASEKRMIREGERTVEKFDSLLTLKREAARTATLMMEASHCVCFTGAGISTSAGIGDYRGKDGKWTLESRQGSGQETEEEGVAYEKLRPTYTHEAVVLLAERGLVRHVISQNGDGLHLLSGLQSDQLSELHGNVFLEKCEKCGHVYERDYYTMDDIASQYFEEKEEFGKTEVKRPRHARKCPTCGLNHRTGRRCADTKCRGFLMDTIINFGDLLEDHIIARSETEAKSSDLCLSLGSTMQVSPACGLVGMGQAPLRLAVCNRQETVFDEICYRKAESTDECSLGVRVFGDCDVFLRELLRQLVPAAELAEWEGKRSERLALYAAKRLES